MRSLIKCLVLAFATVSGSVIADTLVLVSIDGCRWDYPDIHPAPNLSAMAASGARATKMEVVYPSKTFPAHLSLVTGLRPTQHGIIDNNFCDPTRGQCYSIGDGSKDSTWFRGVPLWNLVELNGGRAASYFWPEANARIGGMTPTYYFNYSQQSPYAARVDQVLDWLRLPEQTRPQLVTLYFSSVDTAGHEYGPEDPKTAAAFADIDQLVGRLWSGIQTLSDQKINLIVTADHGMAPIDGAHAILVPDLPLAPGFKLINTGTRVMYYREDPDADIESFADELREAAAGRYDLLDDSYLAERGFIDHPGIPDLMIETQPPASFSNRPVALSQRGGNHGYDPKLADMDACFIAQGPAFKSGTVVPRAHQLDVYPVAARVLGLSPMSSVESDGGALQTILVEGY